MSFRVATRLLRSSSRKGTSSSTKRPSVSSIFCISGITSRVVVSISASSLLVFSISSTCDCTCVPSCVL